MGTLTASTAAGLPSARLGNLPHPGMVIPSPQLELMAGLASDDAQPPHALTCFTSVEASPDPQTLGSARRADIAPGDGQQITGAAAASHVGSLGAAAAPPDAEQATSVAEGAGAAAGGTGSARVHGKLPAAAEPHRHATTTAQVPAAHQAADLEQSLGLKQCRDTPSQASPACCLSPGTLTSSPPADRPAISAQSVAPCVLCQGSFPGVGPRDCGGVQPGWGGAQHQPVQAMA